MPLAQLICAVDDGPSAQATARFAGHLARLLDLRPLLLHAADARTDVALRRAEQRLEALAESQGLGDAEIHVVDEPPVAAIARLSYDADVRLVVAGVGRGGRLAGLRGSVARRLSESAGCPLVLVPDAPADATLERAVVVGAVDDDPHMIRVARAATDTAERLDAEIELVHAVKEVVEVPRGRASLRHALAATALDPRVEEDVGHLHVAPGPTGREVVAFAERAQATLLVVGPPTRGPLRSALLGSTFDELRRHSSIPLMVVPEHAANGAPLRSAHERASRPPRGRIP